MIQVRNVPEELHAELVRRASQAGLTLTDYIQAILEREVSTPDTDELMRRIRARPVVDVDAETVVELIREARGELP